MQEPEPGPEVDLAQEGAAAAAVLMEEGAPEGEAGAGAQQDLEKLRSGLEDLFHLF